MSADWIPFMRQSSRGPWSCMTNAEYRGLAEGDPTRPLLTMLHIPLRDPGPQGLGTAEEANRLDTAFEAVDTRLPEFKALFVARSRDEGHMNFVVYSPTESREPIEDLLQELLPDDSLDIESRSDPQWNVYRQLLPTFEEERAVMDIRVVQVLQEHGDPLTPKRDVRHFIYFTDQAAAKALGDELKREGFKVEINTRPGSTPPVALVASRDDSVALDSITPITTSLAKRAHARAGEYDGWEARLLKPNQGLLSRLFGKKS